MTDVTNVVEMAKAAARKKQPTQTDRPAAEPSGPPPTPLDEAGIEVVDRLTPELFWRILQSYAPVIRDGVTWISFAQHVEASVLLVSDEGWLMISDGVPGASAEIHGASWDGHTTTKVESVLDYVMEQLGLHALVAQIPSHLEGAVRWATSMGFQQTGVHPLAGLWDGQPQNLLIFVRERKA